MTQAQTDAEEQNYNKLKQTEANLIRNLQAAVKDPSKISKLSNAIFQNHQDWLKVIMPNYSEKIHLGIINGYETDERYQSYYDDKAGKGATKILIKVVKDHLAK
ncbi:TipAS antibiotic-recognition domain-containing protein [Lactobacillus sp. ESL0681]|uniref:TipAS antibiotic-recognition domain-containing protein n=1 Tax=Lactobacillus sp. ESL0681 TaxID=2983211 RepID=UPI0023F63C55|nr:TipAS antibiotic-recognition domain-containing protein [Lactobacillus sp. ESL0681]WEV40779.1 TipAS antibiotic-recognition domain-containing protein [Lactobacillus sp. ESL0681]